MKWVFLLRCVSKWNFLKCTVFCRSKCFKAYTHELSVIDFIIVVFVWLSLSLCVLLRFFSAIIFTSSSSFIQLHFGFRWFTLIYLCSMNINNALRCYIRVSIWPEILFGWQKCWLISTIFSAFQMSFIHSFIDPKKKQRAMCVSLSAEIEILLIVYAILTRIYVNRTDIACRRSE